MAPSSLILPSDHRGLFGFVKVTTGWRYDMFPGRYSPPCCWDVFVGSWPDSSLRTRSTFSTQNVSHLRGPHVFPQLFSASSRTSVSTLMRGIGQVCKIHHVRSSPVFFPCCWPLHVIKKTVITHSEKWYSLFAVLFLCVTQTRQVQHTVVICYRGGCQWKHWRFQRFWSSRGSNVRRSAPCGEGGGFQEVQLSVFHNMNNMNNMNITHPSLHYVHPSRK